MVLLLFVHETGHQNSEQFSDCCTREPTRREGSRAAFKIGHVDREQALGIGVEHDHTDTTEPVMKIDPPERQGQAVEVVMRIDDGDRLGLSGRAIKKGIV